jgi:hypothetical protein
MFPDKQGFLFYKKNSGKLHMKSSDQHCPEDILKDKILTVTIMSF